MIHDPAEEGKPVSGQTPYLSYSRINRYLHCPEQYRLYYVENLRLRFLAASLVFGQIVHRAFAGLFQRREDPVKLFLALWEQVKDAGLGYGQKESWEKFRSSGQALLEKFLREELPRIGNVTAAEKSFELRITSLDLPFVGVIDLIADVDGKRTVVDFKTANATYQEHEAVLSDQLTAYQLAEPDAEQTALCVLVKTKEPKIEWHVAARSGEDLAEFLVNADYVAREIADGRFYKRPGKWCSWCDYLPVCLKNEKRAKETLVKIARTKPNR